METETATIDDIVDVMRDTPTLPKVDLICELVEQIWKDFDPNSNIEAWDYFLAARLNIQYMRESLEDN